MPSREESPVLFLLISANLPCRQTSAEVHLIKCETRKGTACCLFQPHGWKRTSALMALARVVSRSGVSQGGTPAEAYMEPAKSPTRPPGCELPSPPRPSPAPAPRPMQLCTRCSESPQARPQQRERTSRQCCVSTETKHKDRTDKAQAARMCRRNVRTPGDTARPR